MPRVVTPNTTEKMKSLLDRQYSWPAKYTFKFLVPSSKKEHLLNRIPQGEISEKSSRSGRYVSVTVVETFSSSEEVLEVYTRVADVEGLISL